MALADCFLEDSGAFHQIASRFSDDAQEGS